MSIRTKLILIVFLTLLFAGSASGFLQYNINSKELIGHTIEDTEEITGYSAQLVNFYLGRVESVLVSLAGDPLVVDALTTKDPAKFALVSDKMSVIKAATDVVENIALQEVDGTRCIPRAANQAALPVVGRDFSDRDYCKGIVKNRERYVSSAFLSAVNNRPVVALVVPVKNGKGELIGFTYASINLNELRGYLWDLQQDSSITLLDRYGNVFLDTKEILTTLDNPPSVLVKEVQNRLANSQAEGGFQIQDSFVGYKSNSSFAVVYEKSSKVLLAIIKYLNLIILFSLVVTLLVAVTIISLLIRKITGRILRLSEAAQKVSGGKFDIELEKEDLEAKDEVAVFARVFNNMTKKLTGIYRDLEEQVKQRTREVEEKNKKLEASEIGLKKALAVAERANDLMVGRELKMIELKKDIDKIKNNKT